MSLHTALKTGNRISSVNCILHKERKPQWFPDYAGPLVDQCNNKWLIKSMIISPPNIFMILNCSKKKRGTADVKDLSIFSSQAI